MSAVNVLIVTGIVFFCFSVIDDKDILNCDELVPLVKSKRAGIAIMKSKDNSQIFVTGHMEYDKNTLEGEYERDISKQLEIELPTHYFTWRSRKKERIRDIDVIWRSTANIFFANWLNYYVYQVTPFEFKRSTLKR